MSTPWDSYFAQERAAIDEAISRVLLQSAPTRTETIIEAWRLGRTQWPKVATEYGMTIVHDLEMIPPMRFEQIRYGDTLCIECEGVIVERTPIR